MMYQRCGKIMQWNRLHILLNGVHPIENNMRSDSMDRRLNTHLVMMQKNLIGSA